MKIRDIRNEWCKWKENKKFQMEVNGGSILLAFEYFI